jgi:hypothetical protein
MPTLEATEEVLTHAPSRHNTGYAAPLQGVAYLCSVAPVHRYAWKGHNVVRGDKIGLGVEYKIEAAPRDGYKVLAVYDTFQALLILTEFRGELERKLEPRSIPAHVVASDLLSQWVGGSLGSSHGVYPGIGLIKGPTPTDDELAHLRSINSLWCEWLVNDAAEHHAQGYWKDIHKIHRLGAEWLYSTGAHQFEWYKDRKQQELKDCPACLLKIPTKAVVCQHCRINLIDFYVKYGGDPDPHVKTFVDKELEKLTTPGV